MSEHGFQIPAGALDKVDAPTPPPSDERTLHCGTCGLDKIVCCENADIDPAEYACIVCRTCRPNEYVRVGGDREHRIVAAEMLGRALEPGEVVHHRNHLKWDNRPENLEVISAADHARMHHENKAVTDQVIADLLLSGRSGKSVAREYHVSVRRVGEVYRRLIETNELEPNRGGQPWQERNRQESDPRAAELADVIANARSKQGVN